MSTPASTLDFSSVGAELGYWLSHIGQSFKGGYSGSGENGIDVPMPTGTPVYAITGGPIKGKGYYGGGGVVSIREQPGRVWYYQHLDLIRPDIEKGQTTQVQAGELIGWSGGQTGSGAHPVTSLQYSNDGHGHGWPHIEIGINAPWGGIWGGGEGPNVDPVPYLRALNNTSGTKPTGTLQGALDYPAGGAPTTPTPTSPYPASPGAVQQQGSDFWSGFWSGLWSHFPLVSTWLADPLRILKFFLGLGLVTTAIILFIVPPLVGPGLQIAGTATANPVLAATGAALTRNPQSLAGRAAEGYGKGLAADRNAREQGRLKGYAERTKEVHEAAVARGKKAAQTRKANRQAKQTQAQETALGEPVRAEKGGAVIGHMRNGQFVPLKQPPEAVPPPAKAPPPGGLTPEDARKAYKDAAAKKEQARQQGRKFINPLE